MSGHSSPNSDHGRGRAHPEHFLETFPTAANFMINPKEFVERLTRIRDNKRNVLEAMGKLKSKFDGDMDKNKLQRLVGLYDDLKKQEDEYLCIFRSVFPGKHGSTDSLPGATAAAGSGTTSSPTGSTGSRKLVPNQEHSSKKPTWGQNLSVNVVGDDAAIYEMQDSQEALVRLLDQHKSLKGYDIAAALPKQSFVDKTDLNKQREHLMLKQRELERLRSKLESFKQFCNDGVQNSADAYDEEALQERLHTLHDRKEHMENLLRQLHKFEEEISQDDALIHGPYNETPTPSRLTNLFDGCSATTGANNATCGKKELESQIENHMQTIHRLKADQARLFAMKNQLLMMNNAGGQGHGRELVTGRLSCANGARRAAKDYFGPSSMVSSAAVSDEDDEDGFEHLDDLGEAATADDDRFGSFHRNAMRKNYAAGVECKKLLQQQQLAYGNKTYGEGALRVPTASSSNFTNASAEVHYQQLQQHINSIRAIFKEIASMGTVEDASGACKQQASSCLCNGNRGVGAAAHQGDYSVNNQQQQQALMLAILTCQQQIQMQQMELSSMRNWFQTIVGSDGSKVAWNERPTTTTLGRHKASAEQQPLSRSNAAAPDSDPVTKLRRSIDLQVSALIEQNKHQPERLVQLLRQLQSSTLSDPFEATTNPPSEHAAASLASVDRHESVDIERHYAKAEQTERAEFAASEERLEILRNATFHVQCSVDEALRNQRWSNGEERSAPVKGVAPTWAQKLAEVVEETGRNLGTCSDGVNDMILDSSIGTCLRDALMFKLSEHFHTSNNERMQKVVEKALYNFEGYRLGECWSELSSHLVQAITDALLDVREADPLHVRRSDNQTKVEIELSQPENNERCQRSCEHVDSVKMDANIPCCVKDDIDPSPFARLSSVDETSSGTSSSAKWLEIDSRRSSLTDPVKFIEHDNQEYSSVTIDYKAVHPNRVKCMNTVTVHVPTESESVKKVVYWPRK